MAKARKDGLKTNTMTSMAIHRETLKELVTLDLGNVMDSCEDVVIKLIKFYKRNR